MKFTDLKLSRFIPGSPDDVFDVWFDPTAPVDRGTARRRSS